MSVDLEALNSFRSSKININFIEKFLDFLDFEKNQEKEIKISYEKISMGETTPPIECFLLEIKDYIFAVMPISIEKKG